MCKQNLTTFLDFKFNNFSSKHSVCINETFANSKLPIGNPIQLKVVLTAEQ